MKNDFREGLLICPSCIQTGHKEILGEITSDGRLSVLRFHKGSTVIESRELIVRCGRCGEVAFFREDRSVTYEALPTESFITGGTA